MVRAARKGVRLLGGSVAVFLYLVVFGWVPIVVFSAVVASVATLSLTPVLLVVLGGLVFWATLLWRTLWKPLLVLAGVLFVIADRSCGDGAAWFGRRRTSLAVAGLLFLPVCLGLQAGLDLARGRVPPEPHRHREAPELARRGIMLLGGCILDAGMVCFLLPIGIPRAPRGSAAEAGPAGNGTETAG